MSRKTGWLVVCALLLGVVPAHQAQAQSTYQIVAKLDGVKGSVEFDPYKDWMAVSSFAWGIDQPVGIPVDATGGTPIPRAFTIVKSVDIASPLLYLLCAQGVTRPKLDVAFLHNTKGIQRVIRYELFDVLVTSVRPGGTTADGTEMPLEEISFSYSRCHIAVYPKKPDGSLDLPVQAGWNFVTNQPARSAGADDSQP